jgi:hypothetical protein
LGKKEEQGFCGPALSPPTPLRQCSRWSQDEQMQNDIS